MNCGRQPGCLGASTMTSKATGTLVGEGSGALTLRPTGRSDARSMLKRSLRATDFGSHRGRKIAQHTAMRCNTAMERRKRASQLDSAVAPGLRRLPFLAAFCKTQRRNPLEITAVCVGRCDSNLRVLGPKAAHGRGRLVTPGNRTGEHGNGNFERAEVRQVTRNPSLYPSRHGASYLACRPGRAFKDRWRC